MKLNKIILIGLLVLMTMSMAFARVDTTPFNSYYDDQNNNFIWDLNDGIMPYADISTYSGEELWFTKYPSSSLLNIAGAEETTFGWTTEYGTSSTGSLNTNQFSNGGLNTLEVYEYGVGGDPVVITVLWDGTTITITSPDAVNEEPIINSINAGGVNEINEGESFIFVPDVTDAEGDATYSWTVNGTEVSTSSMYSLDWVDLTPGTYTVELTISDEEYSNSLSTSLEVFPPLNTAPVINSITPLSAQLYEGETQTFNSDVTDEEGDAEYSWSIDGSEVSGSDSWTVSWSELSPGTYTVTFTAFDIDFTQVETATLVIVEANEEPVINSIEGRIELTSGETQVYTADVTDLDGDATYVWTLGGIVVSTTESYEANWIDITPGIYTLGLEVTDGEYTNSETTTLEIRARGGSASSERTTATPTSAVEEESYSNSFSIIGGTQIEPQQQSPILRFWNWIVSLFGGNK